jgi:hypothetical protein
MMAKTTKGQKSLPVTKKNQTRLNKRNNEEINYNPNSLNDNKKKKKVDNMNATTDELKSKKLDNDENALNGKIEEENKNETVYNEIMEKSDSDDNSIKGDDDEENTVASDDETEEKKESNKIVPKLQPRKKIVDEINIEEPNITADEQALDINTYCETLVGFNRAGKKNMLDNITDQEKLVLCGYVRKEIFRKIKFVNSELLSINSTVMNKLFEQIGADSGEARGRKYLGVRYILQRQLNQKRSYCIEKIIKQMKCMFTCLFCKLFKFLY